MTLNIIVSHALPWPIGAHIIYIEYDMTFFFATCLVLLLPYFFYVFTIIQINGVFIFCPDSWHFLSTLISSFIDSTCKVY